MDSNLKGYYTITKTGQNQYRMEYWLESSGNVDVFKNEMILTKTDADGTHSSKTIQMKVPSIVSATDNEQRKISWKNGGIPVNVDSKNLATGGTYFEVEDALDFNKAESINNILMGYN